MVSSMESLPALLRQTASTSASKVTVPENLEDPTSSAYNQLLAFTSRSLSSLREQPSALQTSRSSLELQLSTLCSRHVHSFVRVRTATAALPSTLDKLDEQLETLIEHDLPALSEASQAFSNDILLALEAKERAKNLLEQYDLSIKDLLDIPRLLMTCARASHPIEALQLGTHMAKIVEMESGTKEGGISTLLLGALRDECWVHLKRLRSDLLRNLGARGVRLPAARRYLSLLRRLELVDEASMSAEGQGGSAQVALSASTICLYFLQARWAVIEEIGTHETDDDVTTQTYSQISAWRDSVGEACGIALALFGDARTSSVAGSDEATPFSLISSFASLCTTKLEEIVKCQIPKIGQSAKSLHDAFESLDTLHTQMAYAASSLSRQGLDFSQTSGCAAIFEEQAMHLWASALSKVVKRFEDVLNVQRVADVAALTGTMDVKTLLVQPPEEAEHAMWSEQAARFPPLAKLANELLDAYESFVVFAPLSIGEMAISSFDGSIGQIVEHLLALIRQLDTRSAGTADGLKLPPLEVAQENIPIRLHEATLAICAKFVRATCASVLPSIRQIILGAFQSQQTYPTAVGDLIDSAITTSRRLEERWSESERARAERAEELERQRVAFEEERLKVAEERKAREEEERTLRAEEQARVEAEEARRKAVQAEIRAKEDEQRRREEEQRRQEEEREEQREEEIRVRQQEAEAEMRREQEATRLEAERIAALKKAALEEAERARREEEMRLERIKQQEIDEQLRRDEEEREVQRQKEEEEKEAGRKAEEEQKKEAQKLKEEQEVAARGEAKEQAQREEAALNETDGQHSQTEKEQSDSLAKRPDEEQQLATSNLDEVAARTTSDQVAAPDDQHHRSAELGATAEQSQRPFEAEGIAQRSTEDNRSDGASVVVETRSTEPQASGMSSDLTSASQPITSQLQAQETPSIQVAQTPKPANRLAEKLRKRQEERERAAAAAKKKAE